MSSLPDILTGQTSCVIVDYKPIDHDIADILDNHPATDNDSFRILLVVDRVEKWKDHSLRMNNARIIRVNDDLRTFAHYKILIISSVDLCTMTRQHSGKELIEPRQVKTRKKSPESCTVSSSEFDTRAEKLWSMTRTSDTLLPLSSSPRRDGNEYHKQWVDNFVTHTFSMVIYLNLHRSLRLRNAPALAMVKSKLRFVVTNLPIINCASRNLASLLSLAEPSGNWDMVMGPLDKITIQDWKRIRTRFRVLVDLGRLPRPTMAPDYTTRILPFRLDHPLLLDYESKTVWRTMRDWYMQDRNLAKIRSKLSHYLHQHTNSSFTSDILSQDSLLSSLKGLAAAEDPDENFDIQVDISAEEHGRDVVIPSTQYVASRQRPELAMSIGFMGAPDPEEPDPETLLSQRSDPIAFDYVVDDELGQCMVFHTFHRQTITAWWLYLMSTHTMEELQIISSRLPPALADRWNRDLFDRNAYMQEAPMQSREDPRFQLCRPTDNNPPSKCQHMLLRRAKQIRKEVENREAELVSGLYTYQYGLGTEINEWINKSFVASPASFKSPLFLVLLLTPNMARRAVADLEMSKYRDVTYHIPFDMMDEPMRSLCKLIYLGLQEGSKGWQFITFVLYRVLDDVLNPQSLYRSQLMSDPSVPLPTSSKSRRSIHSILSPLPSSSSSSSSSLISTKPPTLSSSSSSSSAFSESDLNRLAGRVYGPSNLVMFQDKDGDVVSPDPFPGRLSAIRKQSLTVQDKPQELDLSRGVTSFAGRHYLREEALPIARTDGWMTSYRVDVAELQRQSKTKDTLTPRTESIKDMWSGGLQRVWPLVWKNVSLVSTVTSPAFRRDLAREFPLVLAACATWKSFLIVVQNNQHREGNVQINIPEGVFVSLLPIQTTTILDNRRMSITRALPETSAYHDTLRVAVLRGAVPDSDSRSATPASYIPAVGCSIAIAGPSTLMFTSHVNVQVYLMFVNNCSQ